MPHLHQYHGVFFDIRIMPTHVWVSDPTAFGISTMFVDKLAANDINFLATGMYMRLKMLARRSMHQCRRFTFEIMQRHHPEVALSRIPIHVVGIDIIYADSLRLETGAT